jgi:hypothetical protein
MDDNDDPFKLQRATARSTTDFYHIPAQCQRVGCTATATDVALEIVWESREIGMRGLCRVHAAELLGFLSEQYETLHREPTREA